jgi:pyruvate ferredoxin oxidoreductase alpha subunit
MPDYYYELRYQQAAALTSALDVFAALAAEFGVLSGRRYNALEPYRLVGAETVIVALGSTAGTVKDVVDDLRAEGAPVGLLEIRSFRPLPIAAIAETLSAARRVAVLDRADSPGGFPPLHAEIAAALYDSEAKLEGHVYGLGGRDLHPDEIRTVFAGTAAVHIGVRSSA